jgi:hypothetical protein
LNTPSHVILNLALIGQRSGQTNLAIVVGSLLPDLPIFGFYFWAKFIAKVPESKIWRELYFQDPCQTFVALSHSIPIAILVGCIAYVKGWETLQVICLGCLLHSLEDFPVHHDDAHRHFFPLSNYRFISPISYWDPKHYGAIVAAVELASVAISSCFVFPRIQFWLGRSLLVLVNCLSIVAYFRFYRR